jgi:outer membrane protein TolC
MSSLIDIGLKVVRFILCWSFCLPVAGFAADLDFSQAISLAKKESFDLAKSASESRQSVAERDSQKGRYFPTLSANASAGVDGDSISSLPNQKYNSAGLEARWNVYRFGGDLLQGKKLAIEERLAHVSEASTELTVERNLASTILEVIRLQKDFEVEIRVDETRKNGLDIVKKLYSKGLRSLQDVKKIELDVARESLRQEEALQRLAAAKVSLGALIGKGQTLKSDWPWVAQLTKKDNKFKDKFKVIHEHPEKVAGQGALEVADIAVSESRNGYYPSLDLVGNIHWQKYVNAPENIERTSAALVLTVPIFDGFTTRGKVAQAVELKVIAEERVRTLDGELVARRDRALLVFDSAERSFVENNKLLASAKEIYSASLESFRHGMLSANDLAVDLERVLGNENMIVKSLWDWHISAIDLCHAYGMLIGNCL